MVFWHQDAIFFHEEADTTFVLTVWIPLCDTTEENGCLRVMPRIHKHRTVYWGDSLPDGDWVSVPMKKGDVIFIHKLTPHSSGTNNTDTIRWSMDIRYQKRGTPTGRAFWPSFDARSRLSPDSETDYRNGGRLGLQHSKSIQQKSHVRIDRRVQPHIGVICKGKITCAASEQ